MKMLTMLALTVMIFSTGLLQARLPSCHEFMRHKHPLCIDSGGELIPSENWSMASGNATSVIPKNQGQKKNKAQCLSPFFQKGLL